MNTKDRLMDLVKNTEPKRTIAVDTNAYRLDADGNIDVYICELTLSWYDQEYEVSVTAPYCTICPAYKSGYDIETLTVNGTSDGWEYQLSIDNVSADDEEAIKTLMEERMCWYAFHRGDYTIKRI